MQPRKMSHEPQAELFQVELERLVKQAQVEGIAKWFGKTDTVFWKPTMEKARLKTGFFRID